MLMAGKGLGIVRIGKGWGVRHSRGKWEIYVGGHWRDVQAVGLVMWSRWYVGIDGVGRFR